MLSTCTFELSIRVSLKVFRTVTKTDVSSAEELSDSDFLVWNVLTKIDSAANTVTT